jgi:hypothetical protein
MSDFNWNNISRNLEVINLLEERRKIEEKVKALDEFALVKYEYEILGLDPTNEDIIETEKALSINGVSNRRQLLKLKEFAESQQKLPNDIYKIVNDNFWDLI